jgi:hypothetical protein
MPVAEKHKSAPGDLSCRIVQGVFAESADCHSEPCEESIGMRES